MKEESVNSQTSWHKYLIVWYQIDLDRGIVAQGESRTSIVQFTVRYSCGSQGAFYKHWLTPTVWLCMLSKPKTDW